MAPGPGPGAGTPAREVNEHSHVTTVRLNFVSGQKLSEQLQCLKVIETYPVTVHGSLNFVSDQKLSEQLQCLKIN